MPVLQGEGRGGSPLVLGNVTNPGSGEAMQTRLSQDLALWEELVGELGRCVRCVV